MNHLTPRTRSSTARQRHRLPFGSISLLLLARSVSAFLQPAFLAKKHRSSSLCIFPPPGSGYALPEDEVSELPESYDPMMEYPGTMRPGRTPENMPFHDLPIGDNDPEPIPWPHFQEIEWHHRWEPPNDPPIPMEDFIEMSGRWASPELEAQIRDGARKSVRQRKELAEAEKRETIITDDDDEDMDIFSETEDDPVRLDEGTFGNLGSSSDRALSATATSVTQIDTTETAIDETNDGFDDFLLDLGLDFDLDDDKSGLRDGIAVETPSRSVVGGNRLVEKDISFSFDDREDEDEFEEDVGTAEVTAAIEMDDNIDLDFDDDDEAEDSVEVPLEDYGESDSMDTDDIFDEGGFDFGDDDFDSDGGFGAGDDEW